MEKILIVEYKKYIRDLITVTWQFAGHEVVAFPNGAEAAANAAEVQPELILMDVRMPIMTGYEACEKIKADPATKDIPVVFLSAKGQEAEIQTGYAVGASEYMLKPFAPDELTRKVKEILER